MRCEREHGASRARVRSPANRIRANHSRRADAVASPITSAGGADVRSKCRRRVRLAASSFDPRVGVGPSVFLCLAPTAHRIGRIPLIRWNARLRHASADQLQKRRQERLEEPRVTMTLGFREKLDEITGEQRRNSHKKYAACTRFADSRSRHPCLHRVEAFSAAAPRHGGGRPCSVPRTRAHAPASPLRAICC
jgi:hypothetical protein